MNEWSIGQWSTVSRIHNDSSEAGIEQRKKTSDIIEQSQVTTNNQCGRLGVVGNGTNQVCIAAHCTQESMSSRIRGECAMVARARVSVCKVD